METENNKDAYDAEINLVKDILAKINVSDERTLNLDLIPSIRAIPKAKLGSHNREKVVKALAERLKKLTGVSMPIKDIRGLITPIETSESNIIEISELNKWYGDFHALKNINMSVKEGEIIVVCGPSGSGKSTLIRCVNFLEKFQEGGILVDGTELTDDAQKITHQILFHPL